MSLFQTKSIESLQKEAAADVGLRRSLSRMNLVSLGIGAIIGAGIFVLTGQAAAQYAGPAIAISFVISGLGGLMPLSILGEMVSIGTLFAFVIVCISLIVLRKTRPDAPRPFRTPWVPLVPILGAGICLLQMYALPADTWWRLAIWMAIGIAIYFGYSRHHSKLNKSGR